MPGPSEPKRISPFLNPLVDDLLQLWEGVRVSTNAISTFTLRAALLCFISDIPATRKVCGFPGFRARLGCSKCLKQFPCEGFGERTDYSGYERSNWVIRTKEQHLLLLESQAATPTERQEMQRRHGVSWSCSALQAPIF